MRSSRSPELDPSKRFVEFVRDEREHDREAFNRIAYAKQLLRILSPRAKVALCIGEERLRVEQGGLPGLPQRGRWAIVSIPRDASRAHIALAMARLAGREQDPFILDVLLRARPA